MAHGAQDNYQVRPRDITYTLDDDAELAERLGAVPSIDRLGDVIFIDDFESGLCHWNIETSDNGEIVEETANWSMHGGFSARIYIPASNMAYVKIFRSLPFPNISNIGLEFNITSDPNCEIFIGYMVFYTGTYKIAYGLKFDIPGGKVYYLSQAGTWNLLLENVYVFYASGIFHRGKYIVDLMNNEYRRYSTATGTVSMTGLKPFITLNSTLAHMYIEIFAQGSNSGEIDVYLDSVIVTQNEP